MIGVMMLRHMTHESIRVDVNDVYSTFSTPFSELVIFEPHWLPLFGEKKNLLLSSAEEKQPYEFGTQVEDEHWSQNFIFEWTISQ